MDNFPNFSSENILLDIFIRKLRESITIYIESNNLKTKFYNISDFYLCNKINEEELKTQLFNNIIKELLDSNLLVAHVFNKTGIVITKEKEDFDSNVWKSNLDFTPLV